MRRAGAHFNAVGEFFELADSTPQSYLPFYIRAMKTFRMNDQLSAQERRRFPWADGRKHQKLMEYGQKEIGVWVRKETMMKDGKIVQRFDQYNGFDRQIKVSQRENSDEGIQVRLEHTHFKRRFVICCPTTE